MACLKAPDVRRISSGLTLLELTITLAVLGLLCVIALPGFRQTLDRQRASTARQVLSSHLALARLAAIQRNESILVCPSIDGLACSGDRHGWARGWIIQRAGKDGVALAAAGAPLRQHRLDYPPSFTIRSTPGRAHVRYMPDGRAWGTNLTLQVCVGAELLAEVVVNNSGRVRSERMQHPGDCAL